MKEAMEQLTRGAERTGQDAAAVADAITNPSPLTLKVAELLGTKPGLETLQAIIEHKQAVELADTCEAELGTSDPAVIRRARGHETHATITERFTPTAAPKPAPTPPPVAATAFPGLTPEDKRMAELLGIEEARFAELKGEQPSTDDADPEGRGLRRLAASLGMTVDEFRKLEARHG